MDADEVVVVESDEPRSKQQKLTDFFKRLPSSSQPQEFPCYLRRFQPTDVLRRKAHPKRPVGTPKKSTSSDSTCTDSHPPPDKNNEIEKGAARGVYRSYSGAFPLCLIQFGLIPFRLTKCEKVPFGLKH